MMMAKMFTSLFAGAKSDQGYLYDCLVQVCPFLIPVQNGQNVSGVKINFLVMFMFFHVKTN